jgi:hypothetical protein
MPDEMNSGAPSAPAAAAPSSGAPSSTPSAPAATPQAAQPAVSSAPSAPVAPAGDQQSGMGLADTINQMMASDEQPQEQQQDVPPAQVAAPVEQQEQQAVQTDELPEFTLEDDGPKVEKLYTGEEFQQLAQTNPAQAWQYAQQVNDYLTQTLPAIQNIQAVAEKAGSIETLGVLGDIAAAVFSPNEQTPGNVYASLLKLQEAYPDPDNGPMAQITQSLARFRAPEVIGAIGDQLPQLLDGTHPYLNLETYQPANEYDRYQAQTYIGKLQAQRQALIEQLAPVVYKQFGNDFALKDQYKNVGPDGDYFGLADNTIDKEIRADLPEDLRPVYDSLPPSARARLNGAAPDDLIDQLQTKKEAADARRELEAVKAESKRATDEINAKIEAQMKDAEGKRVESWESQNNQYVADRLTNEYKVSPYAAKVIQRDLKDFFTTDTKAKVIYERAKEAAKAGNRPLLDQLNTDLGRHAEAAIRRSLQEWQAATGQRVQRKAPTTVAPADSRNPTVPLYPSTARPQAENGADRHPSVADTINSIFQQYQ